MLYEPMARRTTSSSPIPTFVSLQTLVDNVRRRQWILLLGALPWIIYLINPAWPFQSLGHMDPWYYFGYFAHFPQYQRIAPTYSGERLTWIIPGYLLARVFGHVYGTLLLHILSYYVSVFSIRSVLARLSDPRTAFATACLLACHPLFIGANGWDFVEG